MTTIHAPAAKASSSSTAASALPDPGTRIRADGSKSARLIWIGEAGGKQEEAQRRAFVGPSYEKQQKIWYEASGDSRNGGFKRSDFYIDNVYPFRPPSNHLWEAPRDAVDAWAANLHDRIAELEDPWIIIPTGDTALRALFKTGLKGSLIGKFRGSILEYTDQRGRVIKMIPTYHPAALFRDPTMMRECVADWRRIFHDKDFRETRIPEREHHVRPTLDDLAWYDRILMATMSSLDWLYNGPDGDVRDRSGVLVIDGEWVPASKGSPDVQVLCVGFAASSTFSMTVPLTLDYWGAKGKLAKAWDYVRRWCNIKHLQKSLQHGLSDAFILAMDRSHGNEQGTTITPYTRDTMAMHHCLDANRPHTLQYMASVDTRQPYWKDEAKDPESIAKYASNVDALWTYNGIDCCVQKELDQKYWDEIVMTQREEFYDRHYAQMFQPLLELMLHGIRTDGERRVARHAELTSELASVREAISTIAGRDLYGKDGLSGTKLSTYLYGNAKARQPMTVKGIRATHEQRTGSGDDAVDWLWCVGYAGKAKTEWEPRWINVADIDTEKSKVQHQGDRGQLVMFTDQPLGLGLAKQLRMRKSSKGGEKTKSVSVDEVAVRRLMLKYPQQMSKLGGLILDWRRKYQLRSFYAE